MRFFQVDVFADAAFRGNPLGVIPEAAGLSPSQMQAIASEMNLSETTFVTSHDRDSYNVRIFTPSEELGFAGHPTLGTSWVLRHLGLVGSDELTQRSRAGETRVRLEASMVWFTRTGHAGSDEDDVHPEYSLRLARGLGVDSYSVGLEARELGRSGHLRPAFADAGLRHLMVPLRDLDALGRIRLEPSALPDVSPGGFYCFTAVQAGRVRARGFFPGVGVSEDPGTGSAAADLGLYLADRMGSIDLEVVQGVEMGRLSRLHVSAKPGTVQVGGACLLVFEGKLAALPPE
ncbi:MAG: PhzF family phenazine biosynthesis protein [Actinomycetota bacterium]